MDSEYESGRYDASGRVPGRVQGVLTGQVPAPRAPWPDCPGHTETDHGDGGPAYCTYCGWNRGQPGPLAPGTDGVNHG